MIGDIHVLIRDHQKRGHRIQELRMDRETWDRLTIEAAKEVVHETKTLKNSIFGIPVTLTDVPIGVHVVTEKQKQYEEALKAVAERDGAIIDDDIVKKITRWD